MIGIYRIDGPNECVYIGSSIDIEKRFKQHKQTLVRNCHRNRHMQFAYNKYGLEAFTFSVVELVNDKFELKRIEQIWLNILFSSLDREQVYNAAIDVTGGMTGRKHSIDALKKMSLAHKGITPVGASKLNTTESIAKMALTKSGGKSYTIVSPDGETFENVTNLTAFAKTHNLNIGNLRLALIGERKHCKNWSGFLNN